MLQEVVYQIFDSIEEENGGTTKGRFFSLVSPMLMECWMTCALPSAWYVQMKTVEKGSGVYLKLA